jgi:hypothetical protein
MKKIILLALFTTRVAYAGVDCSQMAVKAASDVYSNRTSPLPITNSSVAVNPDNTSNGVSLIVTINSSKYLVLLTPSSMRDGSCREVNYVIAYPYANLIRQ